MTAAEDFEPLATFDPDLAERLQPRIRELVEQFLTRGRLSLDHRDEALAQLKIETGVTSGGRVLRTQFPPGSQIHMGACDGSAHQAETLIQSSAELAAHHIVWDQEHVGPTCWEREGE
jgi:hypothetical protein